MSAPTATTASPMDAAMTSPLREGRSLSLRVGVSAGDWTGGMLDLRPSNDSGCDGVSGSMPELSMAAIRRARDPMFAPAIDSTQSPTSEGGATVVVRWSARAISRADGNRPSGFGSSPRTTRRLSSGETLGA
jgi:hypothetical protein